VRDLLSGLDRQLGDTLLLERAELYRMADGVLRLAEALRTNPGLPALRPILDEHVEALRGDRDRRNARISRTKRARSLPAGGEQA
jgi:hypothetical protein